MGSILDGFAKLESNPAAGLTSLQHAYTRSSDSEGTEAEVISAKNAAACNLSLGLSVMSIEESDDKQFDEAIARIDRAETLCPNLDQSKEARAYVHMNRGEHRLRAGEFDQAKVDFAAAYRWEAFSRRAYAQWQSVSYLKAQFKKFKALQGLGKFPDIDGVVCIEGSYQCQYTALILDDKQIGLINHAFDEVYFEDDRFDNSHVMVSDVNHDGYFEQWSYVNRYSESVYTDLDKDGRPDWLTLYSEGVVKEEKPLSGVVSIRISAAIASEADPFSEADSYLVVHHNNYKLGVSSVMNNKTYPTYPQKFITDYRYGDKVTITVMDKDFMYDDHLGTAILDELPRTRYVETSNGEVALALSVSPSDQPEGVYETVRERDVNPFEAPSWDTESTVMANIVKGARKEQNRAQFMASVASFVAPEAILAITMRPVTLFHAFIVGMAGHLGTYEVLTHQNESTVGKQASVVALTQQ